ncbi:MAG TPA: GyrI-like domain-containing protein [Longimicrobium sp.]|nr:GyrI-like domain-containing protein [Longimicrobium sp.]
MEPDRIVEGPAMLMAGLRRVHTFSGAAQSIPEQWQALREMGTLPGQQGTEMYGVMCGADPAAQTFEYMTGVVVASFDALPPGTGRMRIPAQRYAVFMHRGGVGTLHHTWEAIWNDWLPRSEYRMANTPEFELYGEGYDPRTGAGVIEVWASILPA